MNCLAVPPKKNDLCGHQQARQSNPASLSWPNLWYLGLNKKGLNKKPKGIISLCITVSLRCTNFAWGISGR